VLASLALAELLLQVSGVAPPAPAVSPYVDDEAVGNRLNSLGMREEWNELPAKEPGEVRVAFLGDSFTFGQGVERYEAFPAVVGESLAASYPNRTIRVFNLGVMGDNTLEESARYRDLHDELEIDILVLVGYLNDFTSTNPAFTIGEIYGLDFEPGFTARNSLLAATVGRTVRNQIVRFLSSRHYSSSALADIEGGEFEDFGDQIRSLRDFATERDVEFKLAFFPWLFELDDYHLRPVHENLALLAEAEEMEFLDLLEVYEGQDHEAMRASAAIEHPSALGHELAAEAFVGFLLPEVERIVASDLEARLDSTSEARCYRSGSPRA
jgi:hypothetical protein